MLLFPVLPSIPDNLHEVKDWEHRPADKQTQSPAKLRQEGEEAIELLLLDTRHHGVGESQLKCPFAIRVLWFLRFPYKFVLVVPTGRLQRLIWLLSVFDSVAHLTRHLVIFVIVVKSFEPSSAVRSVSLTNCVPFVHSGISGSVQASCQWRHPASRDTQDLFRTKLMVICDLMVRQKSTFWIKLEFGLLDRIAGKFYDRYLMQEVKLYFLRGLQRSFFFGMFVCCMTWMKNLDRKPDLTRLDP